MHDINGHVLHTHYRSLVSTLYSVQAVEMQITPSGNLHSLRSSRKITCNPRHPLFALLSPSAHMRLSRALATRCWPSEHRFLHRPSVSFLPLNCCHPRSHRLPLHRLKLQQHQQQRCGSVLSSVSNSNSSTPATSRPITTMDEKIKQHYLADSPPTVVRLEVKSHFDKLEDPTLRKYAHYISRFVLPWECIR